MNVILSIYSFSFIHVVTFIQIFKHYGYNNIIHFTGGYVNPALTLAFCLCGRLPWKKLPLYNIAQVCGAFLAAFAVYVVYYGNTCVSISAFKNGLFKFKAWMMDEIVVVVVVGLLSIPLGTGDILTCQVYWWGFL